MKKLTLILLALTLAVILLTAVGCRNNNYDLEGKYIATFELNGGTLDYKTSSTRTKINFAYFPNTYILAPESIPGYKLYRTDYDFTGWYTSAECLPGDEWDFENTPITTEKVTLYAGWKKSIKHTYTVCYTDENGQLVTVNSYRVNEGAAFDDWQGFANKRDGYTANGFYSDPELTTPWNGDFTHPGGEVDNDIQVYVSYIVGEWELVSNYAQFTAAMNAGKNIYLTADIDGAGATFSNKNYSGHLEGNGYSISNLTVSKSGSLIMNCTMFNTLSEGAKITNVNFTGITFELGEVNDKAAANGVRIAALARNANGAVISNVTVSGEVITTYTDTLPRLNEAVYDSESTATVDGFSATITVSAPSV